MVFNLLLKMLILVLNVINGLLLLCVFLVSKNDIVHRPTHAYVGYVLIPLFVLATVGVLAVTIATGVAVLVNVDFCSGGDQPGSPQGTIEDVLWALQHQGQVNDNRLELVHDAVDYFWTVSFTSMFSDFPYLCLARPVFQDYSTPLDPFSPFRVNDYSVPKRAIQIPLPSACFIHHKQCTP